MRKEKYYLSNKYYAEKLKGRQSRRGGESLFGSMIEEGFQRRNILAQGLRRSLSYGISRKSVSSLLVGLSLRVLGLPSGHNDWSKGEHVT